ncbi:DUF5050 domain-containing protein [Salisediminibacterium halotolerans]|uniref:DUF5050 domain-containing protein n=1 Tax=Salisediminibacterium halotolerans TaxID=517425 RepID=UPI000EB542F2|nr:DUF5050 domain-containing protein [Salisediminibacterium halotolerans]RLJ75529.1 uncharacterized protein DUF5050 [Actinophytocola xinjiangensis]RPE89382.1 uncharacterized protein DUF5050 [Salisediminibacterium halotolerans]TWG36142.1 uncharacterized protein DUF5050 [Salisediminibacterium halotolerans]GEL07620.1 hypothetical protein SHA02_10360 [Salisediminibacterium halotolerans]
MNIYGKKVLVAGSLLLLAACGNDENEELAAENEADENNRGILSDDNENLADDNNEQTENSDSKENAPEPDPEENIGNFNGNLAQGGRQAYHEDVFYVSAALDEEHGIYAVPLETNEYEQLTDGKAQDMHVTNDGIYYLTDPGYDNDGDEIKLIHYAFDTDEKNTLDEGNLRNLQMNHDGLWYLKAGDDAGMNLYNMDLTTKEKDNHGWGQKGIVIDGDDAIAISETFVFDIDGPKEQELGDPVIDQAFPPVILEDGVVYYNGGNGIEAYDLDNGQTIKITSESVRDFNVRNGTVYFTPDFEAEASRESYRVDTDGTNEENLEGISYTYYMFDDFAVHSSGRHGVILYSKITYDSEESEKIYYTNPGMED